MEKSSGRFKGVDALRGTAVLLMVFSHGLHWAYPGTAHDIILLFGSLSPGDIATPMFYLAAGLSLYFSLQNRLTKGIDPLGLQKWYTLRLAKLMFIGVTISLSWGVLQAQATTLMALVFFVLFITRVSNFDNVRPYLPGGMILALTAHFLISTTPMHPAATKIFSGQFPLFAILFLNVLGFYIAPRLRLQSFASHYIVLGAFLVITGLLLGERVASLTRPGAPLPFLFLGVGLSLLLLGIFELKSVQKLGFFRYLTRVGKDSLFIYLFHYVAFFVPMYLIGSIGQLSAVASLVFSGTMTLLIIKTAMLREGSTVTVYRLLDYLLTTLWSCLLQPIALRTSRLKGEHSSYLFRNPQRIDH